MSRNENSHGQEGMLLSLHTNKYYLPQEENKAPTVGFEPTTFGLEVQRASPLRHAGLFFDDGYRL